MQSSTNCNVHLTESIFQTHSRACLKNKSCTKHIFPRPFS
ncbi:MAG: DUF6783 domain-containing protein [Anaerobutyricum hallii]